MNYSSTNKVKATLSNTNTNNKVIYGSNNSDTLTGSNENDTIYGLDGNDVIFAMDGDDILIGGKGDDVLIGGNGNDTYRFSQGDGADIISNYAVDGKKSFDQIEFTNVHSSDATFYQQGNDLIIVYAADESDQIKVIDFFTNSLYEIDLIQFTDKNLTTADIKSLATIPPKEIYGSNNSDTITGTNNNETIYGLDGNDAIWGMGGDDILIGGKGNDYLFGGLGNDTYIFSKGDGADVVSNFAEDGAKTTDRIEFTDVNSQNVKFHRDGDNLIIIYSDNGSDQVLISDFFKGNLYEIDSVKFTDREFSAAELKDIAIIPPKPPKEIYGSNNADTITGTNDNETIYGLDGNDVIWGMGGDDIIIGGKGNDALMGGLGNDTYIFSKGDGSDIISNYATDGATTTDRIEFTDVSSQSVKFHRDGDNLIIIYSDNGSDQVLISDFFKGNLYEIDSVKFTDRELTAAELKDIAIILPTPPKEIYGSNNSDTLTGTDDGETIYGLNGNDAIWGMGGDDIIIGGRGDDYLFGGLGNDTYIFSKGDGSDVISNYAEDGATTLDRIEFTDVSSQNVKFHRDGDNLIIIYSDNGSDQILITDFFKGNLYEIDSVKFTDRELTAAELKDIAIIPPIPPKEIYGSNNADTITGTNDNETIYGLDGNDAIWGMGGDDIIIGGKGNDALIGGLGNDTYVFSQGDGSDTIYNYEKYGQADFDRIEFTDVSSENAKFYRDGDDLIIVYSLDQSDQIKISGFFNGALYEIDLVQFTDKNLTASELKALATTPPKPGKEIFGSNNNDSLRGSNDAETIYGLDGNDNIRAMGGDDVLIGGKGNDRLEGGLGNDTYLFSKGDGTDEIVNYAADGASSIDKVEFTDVKSDEATFYRQGNHLIIVYSEDGSDRIQLTNFFSGNRYEMDIIKFTDREYLTNDILNMMLNASNTYWGSDKAENLSGTNKNDVLYGFAGDDRLNGLAGDDILIGGKGNDRLEGGLGNDTYLFSKGDGNDEIVNYASDGAKTTDKVEFTDVTSEEATFYRQGNHLIIVYSEDGSDRIQLTNFFSGNRYEMDIIKFTDREYLANDILNMMKDAPNTYWGTDKAENLSGTNNNDVLYGLDGNDRLYGRAGDDILIGGKGNDRLEGGLGNDTYLFSKGDGNDEIVNYASDGAKTTDKIIFTDIKSDEAIFERQGNNLIIIYSADQSDRIQLTNYFRGDRYEVDIIQFTDQEYSVNDVSELLSSHQARLLSVSTEMPEVQSVNQELHSMINAMASFESANDQDITPSGEISLTKPLITTTAY